MNNITDMIKNAMDSIKGMIDSSTVVGEAITTPDGSMIIPVTQVTCGFGAGGSEIPAQKEGDLPFGGGSGGGIKVKPVAFLVISKDRIRILPVETTNGPVDKILDLVPDMVDKVNRIVTEHKEKKVD